MLALSAAPWQPVFYSLSATGTFICRSVNVTLRSKVQIPATMKRSSSFGYSSLSRMASQVVSPSRISLPFFPLSRHAFPIFSLARMEFPFFSLSRISLPFLSLSRKAAPFLNFSRLLLVCALLLPAVGLVSCKSDVKTPDKQHALTERAEEVARKYAGIHRMIYVNPAAAREDALKLLSSPDVTDTVSQVVLLKHMGSSYVFETNYSEALNYYNRALALAEAMHLFTEVAHLKNNIGVIHNELGNYKLAYSNLAEAISNYELAGNTVRRVAAYNNIGITFLNLKNYDKALQFFEKALAQKGSDTILVVSVLNNIALAYNSQENAKRALEYLDKAVALSEKVDNRYGLCISYQLRGSVYRKTGMVDQSLQAYEKSVEIARDNNLSNQLAQAKVGLTQVLIDKGQLEEATIMADEVKKMADDQKSLILSSEAHSLLSDLYARKGEYKASLHHLKEHIRVKEDIVNQTIIHQIYDVELSTLSRQNLMQQLELERTNVKVSKKNSMLILVSVTFVLLSVGMYLLYLNHRHRQKVRLQETIIELTGKKAKAALQAEIEERKRIGNELHDSLGHLLSVAGLHASVLKKRTDISDEKREEILQSLMKTVDDAFDEVRNISHNLAPSLLSERGLEGALKSIADRVNQTTGLTMSYDTFGLETKMDTLIEHTLYRTIQEIVSNTIKHSRASRLFIQITRGDNEISLMAEDDGLGFNYAELRESGTNGLANMQTRIENLHGNMFVDSQLKRGTIISILIPL